MTLDDIVRYFDTMSPESVADLGRVYTEDAFFKDPFNEVRGRSAIEDIFRRMYVPLIDPRFVVVNRIATDGQAMLEWDFHFRIRRYRPDEVQTVHGVSHLRFAADGRIDYHRDYWDTAEELYAKLPLIGGVMRFLRHRMG